MEMVKEKSGYKEKKEPPHKPYIKPEVIEIVKERSGYKEKEEPTNLTKEQLMAQRKKIIAAMPKKQITEDSKSQQETMDHSKIQEEIIEEEEQGLSL